ncbi:hypothetical protein [Paraburkholderia aromaticivorans]|uniref:hypothetical protein n=1 Tax=Paraburkholderia aromaticivorans TaxID=2026199 RepID=UPI001455FAC4
MRPSEKKQRDVQDAETCCRVENGGCTQAVRKGTGDNTGHKRNDAAKQVDEAECGCRTVVRRDVSNFMLGSRRRFSVPEAAIRATA